MSKDKFLANMEEFKTLADTAGDEQSVALLEGFVSKTLDFFSGETAMAIKGIQLNLNKTFDNSSIQELCDATALSEATGRMARYVMANEGLGQLFKDDKIAGYGDDEFNPERLVGSDLLEFRDATNSILREVNLPVKGSKTDETSDQFIATNYTEELPDDFESLTINERFQVMATWDTIDSILSIKDHDDFTANRPVESQEFDYTTDEPTGDFDIMNLINNQA